MHDAVATGPINPIVIIDIIVLIDPIVIIDIIAIISITRDKLLQAKSWEGRRPNRRQLMAALQHVPSMATLRRCGVGTRVHTLTHKATHGGGSTWVHASWCAR
jgi:hypothetical protein